MPSHTHILVAVVLLAACLPLLSFAANSNPWSGTYEYIPSCNETSCCCPAINGTWLLQEFNQTSGKMGVNFTIPLNSSNPNCLGATSDFLQGNETSNRLTLNGVDQNGFTFQATYNTSNDLIVMITTPVATCTAVADCIAGDCLISKNPSNASPQGQNSSNPNGAASPASHPAPAPSAAPAAAVSTVAIILCSAFALLAISFF